MKPAESATCGMITVLFLLAALACVVPACRAAALDPTAAGQATVGGQDAPVNFTVRRPGSRVISRTDYSDTRRFAVPTDRAPPACKVTGTSPPTTPAGICALI